VVATAAFGRRRFRWVLGWITALAFGCEALKIGVPEFVVMFAQVIKHVPGIETAIMAIAEYRAYGVVADRFNALNADVPLADLKRLLARPVTTRLG
jgi:hypothetical protein